VTARTLVIGLTGGIGSGKSSVAAAFERRGAPVVDVDAIAHELSRPGAAGTAAVAAEFGAAALDASGALDRAWLRKHTFGDEAFRRRLEAALHPLIAREARRRLAAWDTTYGLLMVPLLFERGNLLPLCDRVLVVDCPEALQIERVRARSGLTEAEVRAIMATQVSREDRLARADDVIDNAGSLGAIEPQVEVLDSRYRAIAAGAPAPPVPRRLRQNGG
jgi:dephospho-CoA kinase